MEVELYPHLKKGSPSKLIPLICNNPDCECLADAWIDREVKTPEDGFYAACPKKKCKGQMVYNWSGLNITVTSRGPGVSSTKYGMRRARELTAKNEKLGRTQWDNVEPLKLTEGATPRNPTKDGPYDTKGRMAKKRKSSK